MRNKAALQDYCLQTMGITQWQLRSHSQQVSAQAVIIIEPPLLPEEKQLLERILHALGWPVTTPVMDRFTFNALNTPSEKALVFGEDLATTITVKSNIFVVVPALAVLLQDRNAKKQAWDKMQRLL